MDYNTAIADFNKLTNDDDRTKEVYAHFGVAVFNAQLIEQQAINLIVFERQVRGKLSSQKEIDELWDSYEFSNKTLGNLINEIKQLYNLSDEDYEELKIVLKSRNYIAHDYFRLNAGLWYSDGGKQRMIKDFIEFVDSCKKIDKKLDEYSIAFYAKIGFTKELAKQHLDETIISWSKQKIDSNYKTFKK